VNLFTDEVINLIKNSLIYSQNTTEDLSNEMFWFIALIHFQSETLIG